MAKGGVAAATVSRRNRGERPHCGFELLYRRRKVMAFLLTVLDTFNRCGSCLLSFSRLVIVSVECALLHAVATFLDVAHVKDRPKASHRRPRNMIAGWPCATLHISPSLRIRLKICCCCACAPSRCSETIQLLTPSKTTFSSHNQTQTSRHGPLSPVESPL